MARPPCFRRLFWLWGWPVLAPASMLIGCAAGPSTILTTTATPLPGARSTVPAVIADTPATASTRAPVGWGEYRRTYDAARTVLRDAGFTLARQDYRFGHIATDPLGSPTFAEPWKGQNADLGQALASTLQDLRRRVSVTLEPRGDAASPSAHAADHRQALATPYTLGVEVTLERHQTPARYLPNTDRPSVFAELSAVPDNLADRGVARDHWQPVGRDIAMERRLLHQILASAKSPAP